ncbi:MAG: phosphoribosyl-ATP diphosphatase [Alphaproteobacteria bacterium]
MTDELIDGGILDGLFQLIDSRHGKNPKTSYTAKLLADGRGAITRKIGEEATETIVAALDETEEEVIKESADLLYHLLVLWSEMGVRPADVWAELQRREGTSGIDEKNSRKNK